MSDGVDLYWIPLGAGAGGAIVRWNGRLYEALAAALARRPRCDLYHSALEVHLDGVTAAVEMAYPRSAREESIGRVTERRAGAGKAAASRADRATKVSTQNALSAQPVPAMIVRAVSGSLLTLTGPPTAAARSGIDPPRQQRTS